MTGILISVVAALIASLLCAEAKAWVKPAVRALLNAAISRVPEHLRDRLQEEWAAYLDEMPGNVGKLVSAVGFFTTASKMRFSHKLDAWLLPIRLRRVQCVFIFKLAYAQSTTGPLLTRIPRAIDAARFAAQLVGFFLTVTKNVADGVVPHEFGKNLMQGTLRVIRSKAYNEPPACWSLHATTGEVAKVPGGEPGEIIILDPQKNDHGS